MSRRRRGLDIHGVVLLDKPAGLSSNQALQRARRAFDARKAGHTGTLDPFATGMLPVCLGEATKTTAFMLDADKCYRARARLGQATTTGDPEGEVVRECPVPEVSLAQIDAALHAFEGEIEQVPPMHSALKQDGKRLYELAREGRTVARAPRRVTIHRLRRIAWNPPELDFEVLCAKGTYVRVLAEDLARALGSCAHLASLRRLYVAPFEGEAMVTLAELEARSGTAAIHDCLLPVDAGLEGLAVVRIADAAEAAFRHGNAVACPEPHPGTVRVYGAAGGLLGLGECRAGRLHPRRVLQLGAPAG